jgi:hypothetical protein
MMQVQAKKEGDEQTNYEEEQLRTKALIKQA